MMTGLVPSWCMHQVERRWSMLQRRMNWNLLRAEIDLDKLNVEWKLGICDRYSTWTAMISVNLSAIASILSSKTSTARKDGLISGSKEDQTMSNMQIILSDIFVQYFAGQVIVTPPSANQAFTCIGTHYNGISTMYNMVAIIIKCECLIRFSHASVGLINGAHEGSSHWVAMLLGDLIFLLSCMLPCPILILCMQR